MRLFRIASALQILAARLVIAAPLDSPEIPSFNVDPAVDPLDALARLQEQAYGVIEQQDKISKRGWTDWTWPWQTSSCNLFTATVRKDW